jgi:hypothetical protein
LIDDIRHYAPIQVFDLFVSDLVKISLENCIMIYLLSIRISEQGFTFSYPLIDPAARKASLESSKTQKGLCLSPHLICLEIFELFAIDHFITYT